jgi:hypothetical protein
MADIALHPRRLTARRFDLKRPMASHHRAACLVCLCADPDLFAFSFNGTRSVTTLTVSARLVSQGLLNERFGPR